MSDLLNQASLVMVPSGYKEDTVYSVVPTDGSGDLSFTRASNGTRVNSAGLVEVCPWNFVSQSESIGTSPWLTNGATLTSGQTDPSGGTTAVKVQLASGGNNYVYQGIPLTNPINVVSAYLRADSATTIGFSMGGSTPNAVNLTTSWQLFTFSSGDTSGGIIFDNYFGPSPTQQAKTFYIWHPQLNIGSTAKPYFPTTDRLNVPRLNYQNGGGGCPSLLLEKQSTNLFYPSEDFSGGSQNYITYTANTTDTLDPSGQNNADKFVVTTSGGDAFNRIGRTIAIQNFSLSVYVKGTAGQKFQLFLARDSYAEVIDTDVLTTGDWQRVVVSGTFSTTSSSVVLGFEFGYTSDDSVANQIYYLWGAQLEASSYATSYIPTTSSSATRVADVYSRSLSSIASGTAYVNITDNVALETPGTHVYGPFAITSASLGLYLSRPNNQRLRLWTAASNNVFQTTQTNLKLAITWDGTNVNVYQNGVKVVTSYSYAITNVNNLFSSTAIESSATIAEIALFNSVLTDAECISLTS